MDENFKTLLQVMISSGERTRALLYILGIIFLAIFAVYVDFDEFNWTAARHTIIAHAYACYIHDKVNPPLKSQATNCKKYYNILKDYYDIDVDQTDSDNPTKILDAADDPKSFEPMKDRYDLLSQAYVENAYTTIPFLGVKIEKNNGLLDVTVAGIVVLGMLQLSISNEIKCAKIFIL
jgi:hypothetical protein